MESSRKRASYTIFYGSLINPKSLLEYEALPRAVLAYGPDGNVLWIEADVERKRLHDVILSKMQDKILSINEIDLKILSNSQFIMPGFIDTHTHAPQLPNMGSGQQYELLAWLENITFPMEARFADVEFARKVYPEVVKRFISLGTTTCCYYGSLHLESTKVLADAVSKQGQRALVGKCNMNRNSPDYYQEVSTDQSIKDTKELISYIRSLNSNLVHPILTPRFAISCTDDLLFALGRLAKQETSLAIQTHISENKGEIFDTQKLFPKCSSYADVYYQHGLLTERTILGHGVHLGESELKLIAETRSGISHCPTSNFNLSSGMARVGEMLDRGIKVGLGTDVSGGFSPSMLTAIQHASMCSKMVAIQSPLTSEFSTRFAGKQLKLESLLYLATMGGASLCCMEDKIGSFAPGKAFDALLVDLQPEETNPAVWYNPEHGSSCIHDPILESKEREKRLKGLLERFLFGGDDRNILNVFVQGNCIKGRLD